MVISYSIALEVAGPFGMFARPDTGSTPVSYAVPTFSAAKGIFESVARIGQVFIKPVKLEVCKPIRFERYVTNYGGPLRKGKQVNDDNNYQLFATVLIDVHYRIFAEVIAKKFSTRGNGKAIKRRRYSINKNWESLFKSRFEERLANGQSYYTPCLGWKEFVPTYFGPLQPGTKPDASVNLTIPSLLQGMWEEKTLKPRFVQDWQIAKGVMSYQHGRPDDAQ